MQPDPTRPEVVLSADLLASEGYGEIVGGAADHLAGRSGADVFLLF
jgi:aspartyl/asparaginyl-tRNA synthetase